MENDKIVNSFEHDATKIPSLIKFIASNEVSGFDNIEDACSKSADPSLKEIESESISHRRMGSISISMPVSPTEIHLQNPERVLFSDETREIPNFESETLRDEKTKPAKFYSQPMPTGSAFQEAINGGNFKYDPNVRRLKDKRFDSFKTWSGKLDRQITSMHRKQPPESGLEETVLENQGVENLPVDRYFDALEGPELDTLKASEEILLPEDQTWPFLLRYPISSFGICLGISSQAIMWKALATSSSMEFLHISLKINLLLWSISIGLTAIVAFVYLLKIVFYFEAVRREYYHPIRVNFFFAPWIALLFLAIGVPPSVASHLPQALWYILMAPIFCIELKIYGQWMLGGQRRLSKVANPSNHLSVVGNFVGALLGASMGLKEGPLCFFAIGLAHYSVLFVTLYQRLPTNETLPKELHPVFFLFVAAPSVASMAWSVIQGSFNFGSRIAYFVAVFLYLSLAVRINFFRGFKFSLAWWAYTFPMTGAATATIRYSNEVTNVVTQSMSIIFSLLSTLTVIALLVTTVLHAFLYRDLFPNDISIAIIDRKPKQHKAWFHRRHGSSESKDIEKFLKYSSSV